MHYIYMLRCRDGSVYTGIASELENRMKTHFEGGAGCSKYVASRGAQRLECCWICGSASDAARLEYRLKRLSKKSKEMLIAGTSELEDFLNEKLDCELYRRGNLHEAVSEKYFSGD